MKLLEQYLYAIGQHLPFKGRSDIIDELRSLLLDEIESRGGANPSSETIEAVIIGFGTPREVARRYTSGHPVIAPGLSDLYFLIMKIMAFSMAIAFTVIFVITLFTDTPSGMALIKAILAIPLRTAGGLLSGIGGLTVAFILITRFAEEPAADLDADWTIADLKGIKTENEPSSITGSIIGIFFSVALIVLLNVYPEIITVSENSFSVALPLGHAIDIERFRIYVYFLSALWIMDIAGNLLTIRYRVQTKMLDLYNIATSALAIVLFSIMLNDTGLYLYDNGFIGYKVIFLIILAVNAAETIAGIVRLISGKRIAV